MVKIEKGDYVVWLGNTLKKSYLVNRVTSSTPSHVRLQFSSGVRPKLERKYIVKVFSTRDSAEEYARKINKKGK